MVWYGLKNWLDDNRDFETRIRMGGYMKSKACPKCKKEKPLDEFYKSDSIYTKDDGYHSIHCKECVIKFYGYDPQGKT